MWNPTEIMYALIGGSLIGFAASIFLLGNGRVMGVSGIFKGMLFTEKGDVLWRYFFFAGILLGGATLYYLHPTSMNMTLNRSLAAQIIGGLLVGVGITIGNGCTSGHGVCGVSRFSKRSIWATIVFSVTGIIVATFITLLLGGRV